MQIKKMTQRANEVHNALPLSESYPPSFLAKVFQLKITKQNEWGSSQHSTL